MATDIRADKPKPRIILYFAVARHARARDVPVTETLIYALVAVHVQLVQPVKLKLHCTNVGVPARP